MPQPRLRARLRHRASHFAKRLDVIAIFPLCAIVAYGLGHDAIAWVFMLVLPSLLAVGSMAHQSPEMVKMDLRPKSRTAFVDAVETVMEDAIAQQKTTAVLILEIEELFLLHGTWGAAEARDIMDRVTERVSLTVRKGDVVARCGDTMIAIALDPVPRADLDIAMAIVDRLQSAVAEPLTVNGRILRARCSIGVCTAEQAPAHGGSALVAAAECALGAARRMGDGAVRLFTTEMQKEREIEHQLTDQVTGALENGDIQAWYQPQISTDTGAITGFEVLARWQHPDLGVLTPANFLPAVRASHQLPALGETMLDQAIQALTEWDAAGIRVPCLGLNMSLEELRDPRLAERIAWQVDRYDLKAERFCIEILESVALAEGDEAVTTNLARFRSLGFRLDLDDFGTGQSSIAHVAKFGVDRIKIDRSFITSVDTEPQQKQVLAAILAMAGQLGIDTLAEGVETPGEHTVLAQLGCTHAQGYGIARPMPFDQTLAWATEHNRQITTVPMIKRRRSG